jgi:hypothetical protein
MISLQKKSLLLGLAISVAGCQAQSLSSGQTLTHVAIHTGQQCGAESPQIDHIASSADLLQAIGARSLSENTPSPKVDWTTQVLLRVSMGQQPSAGAQVGVKSIQLNTTTGELTMNVQWQLPNPNLMHAAVITRPCVIVQIPQGKYGSARAMDGNVERIKLMPIK